MMAKQVVQLRKQQEKLYKGKAQINGVSQMAKSAQATQAMMKGMSTATQAMQQANAAMQPAEISRMAMEFERQSAQLEMAQETMCAASPFLLLLLPCLLLLLLLVLLVVVVVVVRPSHSLTHGSLTHVTSRVVALQGGCNG